MSYSQAVRTSLAAHDPETTCCRAALLGGLLAVGGRRRPEGLALEVETAAVARLAFRLARARGDLVPHLAHGGHPYRVTLGDAADRAASGPGRKTCCRRAWLRGAFLAGGSLTRPEHGYHLEFSGPEEAMAQVSALLAHDGIRAGRDERRMYVKAAEDIVAFLSAVGATAERLAYEQVLMGRDLKNRVQRAVNCETANLSRTVDASRRQVALIEGLIGAGMLDLLPSEVQATARLRLDHPFATLADLADLHDPPVSKSAVNHRLRALFRAASH
ncbi:MAG: DNA-binding protein WhiA [Candidatus Sericytochromatia bacterium]|nr:DNA-binding protein WhiA [Candidatus Tanganyikabacteria bacterium]